jgi:predicted RNase H-like HicB family nuclease
MSDEFNYTFKRHDIALTRDREDANWYIRVRGPDGLHKYDGYWRESAGKTLKEALQEAKEGALLVSPPSP